LARGSEITSVGDRLRAMMARLAFATGWALSFAVGSVRAFLCFSWPPLLREIVLGYRGVPVHMAGTHRLRFPAGAGRRPGGGSASSRCPIQRRSSGSGASSSP
jgi:hypothetical protein